VPETYSYSRSEDVNYGIYYRFNNHKFEYVVYFNNSIYSDLVSGYDHLKLSYSLGFFSRDENEDVRKNSDNKVRDTIIEIVVDFLRSAEPETVLLFHCNISDNRQYMRHLTFARWYKQSEVKDMVKMETIQVDIKETKNYVGYIVHSENPNSEKINDEFEVIAYTILQEQK
jgi:hypothetical protein